MTPKTLAQASSAWRNLAGDAGQLVAIEWSAPDDSSEPETSSGAGSPVAPQALSESDRLRYQSIQSKTRRAAFLAGRRALALLAESAGAPSSVTGSWPEGPDALLSLEPRGWLASLSHSAGLAVAVGVPLEGEPQWLGVGVDLERADRVVEDAVAARILSEPEQTLGVPPLLAWSLKEAAFKADDSPSPTWVSLYQVVEFDGPGRQATLVIEDPVSPRVFQASWVIELGWQMAFCVRQS